MDGHDEKEYPAKAHSNISAEPRARTRIYNVLLSEAEEERAARDGTKSNLISYYNVAECCAVFVGPKPSPRWTLTVFFMNVCGGFLPLLRLALLLL